MEKEYFDIEDPAVEGDDLEPTAAEVDAVADVLDSIPAMPPAPQPKAPVVANLDLHAKSAAAGAPYPTEEPDDPATIWSPRPGVIGSKNQGFRKIRRI